MLFWISLQTKMIKYKYIYQIPYNKIFPLYICNRYCISKKINDNIFNFNQ